MLVSEMDLMEFFLQHEKIALYGTGGMGTALHSYLKRNGWEQKLAFFVVSEKKEEVFGGVPVKEVHSLRGNELATPILLSVRRQHHESIRRELAIAGAGRVQAIDEDLLTKLEKMAQFVEQENQDEKMRFFLVQMRQMAEGMNLLYQKMNRMQDMLGELKDEKN